MPFCVYAASALILAAIALHISAILAQSYPTKPIRIVTTEAGGGLDFSARVLAQGLSASIGQQAIVENRSGGLIPAETVARAAPDGYTLLVHGGTFLTAPLLAKLSYDPVRDFLPISLLATQPNILVVHPSVPVKTVNELIALAKQRPGELNYGSASTGSTPHLAAELFKVLANVNIMRIPYKGTGAALNDLMAGHVQLIFAAAPSVTAHVKSGRLRALAVTSTKPTTLAPGLPAVGDSVPGYEAVAVYGLFAPANTPEPIIKRLNEEVVRWFRTAEVKERFFLAGSETVGSTPEELKATVKSEMARIGKVIKDAGIKLD